MSRYSGNSSFEFEIERYKDKDTGELLTYDKIEDDSEEFEYEYTTFSLQVEGRSYFEPGKFSGHPENCYPDEGDTEILSVTGEDGKDWEDQLTDEERGCVICMIEDHVREGECDGPDPDDYYDDRD